MRVWFKLSAAAALAVSLVASAPLISAQPTDPMAGMPPGVMEMLTPEPIVPVDPATLTTPQAKLERFLLLSSMSKLIKIESFSEDPGTGALIGRGAHVDLSTIPDSPFKTIPLGDLTVTGLDMADVYVRNYRMELTGAALDVAELRAFVMSSPMFGPPVDPNAPPPPPPSDQPSVMGPPPPDQRMEALGALAFVEGLGYTRINVRIYAGQALDPVGGDITADFGIEFSEAFAVSGAMALGGITDTNIREIVALTQQMYLGGAMMPGSMTPEQQAEMEAKFKDPNGPFATISFKFYEITFANLGLLDRLKPMLDPLRVQLTGAGPNDPIPEAKFEEMIADAMTTFDLPREKVEGPIREVFAFVMQPTRITVRIRTEPPVSVGEFVTAMSAAEAAAPTDPNAPQTPDAAVLAQFKERLIIEVTR